MTGDSCPDQSTYSHSELDLYDHSSLFQSDDLKNKLASTKGWTHKDCLGCVMWDDRVSGVHWTPKGNTLEERSQSLAKKLTEWSASNISLYEENKYVRPTRGTYWASVSDKGFIAIPGVEVDDRSEWTVTAGMAKDFQELGGVNMVFKVGRDLKWSVSDVSQLERIRHQRYGMGNDRAE